MASAGELLNRLSTDLHNDLGDGLLGVAAHGSWVSGDFVEGRSGLGVLVILREDPGRETLGIVSALHQRLIRDYPRWRDHMEIDFVSPTAVQDALDGGESHVMARICPGELLHLARVSLQYLLNWRSAVEHNHVLYGRAPGDLLPHITDEVVREAVLQNVRRWPDWADDLPGAGGEAYAVLTLCRASVLLRESRWVSKRVASEELEAQQPRWAALIRWAREWWYAAGLSIDTTREAEVSAFVRELSGHLIEESLTPLPAAG